MSAENRPEIRSFSRGMENKEIEPNLKTALIYAGQGQDVLKLQGQVVELLQLPVLRPMFRGADEILYGHFPQRFKNGISHVITKGDKEDVEDNLQVIVTLNNLGCSSLLSQSIPERANIIGTSGQSLGLISAYAQADVLSFEDTLILTVGRHDAMRGAQGTLAGFALGDSDERIKRLKDNYGLQTSIRTSSSFVVLGGEIKAINDALKEAEEDNIRVFPLNTPGAFHTSFMEKSAKEFQNVLKTVHFNDAEINVFANTSGLKLRRAGSLRNELQKQMTSTVLWVDSIKSMTPEQFIEIGSNGILAGHIQRDIESETGEKGKIIKRVLKVGGAVALPLGVALIIKEALKHYRSQ